MSAPRRERGRRHRILRILGSPERRLYGRARGRATNGGPGDARSCALPHTLRRTSGERPGTPERIRSVRPSPSTSAAVRAAVSRFTLSGSGKSSGEAESSRAVSDLNREPRRHAVDRAPDRGDVGAAVAVEVGEDWTPEGGRRLPGVDAAPGSREERENAVDAAADIAVDRDGVGMSVTVDVPDRDVEGALAAACLGAGGFPEGPAGPEGVRREDLVREALRAAREELRPAVLVDVERIQPRHGGRGRAENVRSSEAAVSVAPVQPDVWAAGRRREVEPSIAVEIGDNGSGQRGRRLKGRHGPEAVGPVAPEKDERGRRTGDLHAQGVEDPVAVEVTDRDAPRAKAAREGEGPAGISRDAHLAVRAEEEIHPSVPVEVPGAEDGRPRHADAERDRKRGEHACAPARHPENNRTGARSAAARRAPRRRNADISPSGNVLARGG